MFQRPYIPHLPAARELTCAQNRLRDRATERWAGAQVLAAYPGKEDTVSDGASRLLKKSISGR